MLHAWAPERFGSDEAIRFHVQWFLCGLCKNQVVFEGSVRDASCTKFKALRAHFLTKHCRSTFRATTVPER